MFDLVGFAYVLKLRGSPNVYFVKISEMSKIPPCLFPKQRRHVKVGVLTSFL